MQQPMNQPQPGFWTTTRQTKTGRLGWGMIAASVVGMATGEVSWQMGVMGLLNGGAIHTVRHAIAKLK